MKYFERAVIGLFSAIALAALVWAIVIGLTNLFETNGWKPLSASDWGTWVGAIGTVVTLAGTIYLATTETRRRERRELLLAHLHGAALSSRITAAQNTVLGIAASLGAQFKVKLNQPTIDRCFSEMTSLSLWTIDEVAPLAPLPNNAAANLVRVVSEIAHVTRNITSIKSLLPQTYEGFTDNLLTDTLTSLAQIEVWIASAMESIADDSLLPPNL